MKFLKCILRGFTPFKFSKIDELDINYTHDLQVILGTNSSGKSSYLRTLTPYPLARSLFEEKTPGYRELVIEHLGHVYTLISDYSNKTSPHQFIKDDEGNLNEGGTTGVQVELVEKYLGLNRERENLLFGELAFCNMAPGQVKPFLMKTCPLDLGWILDKQKKTSSTLRNIKAELKYLTSRETQLLSEMLKEEELKALQDRKVKHHKAIATHIGEKSHIKTRMDYLNEEIKSTEDKIKSIYNQPISKLKEELTLEDISIKMSKDNPILEHLKDVKKEDYPKHEYRLTSLDNEGSKIVERINEIDASLSKSDDESATALALQITSDRNRTEELKGEVIPEPILEEDLREIKLADNDLKECLAFISKASNNKRIWSVKHLRHKEYIFSKLTTKMEVYKGEVERLEKAIEDLEKEIMTDWSDSISPCAKERCALYVISMTKKNQRLKVLEEYKAVRLNRVNFINRYEDYVRERSLDLQYRHNTELALDKLKDLVVNRCPSLLRFIRRSDILDVLSRNPYKLYKDILSYVKSSELTNEYNFLLSRIADNEKSLKAIDKISESYKKYLLKDKAKLEKELEAIKQEHDKLYKIVSAIKLQKEIDDLTKSYQEKEEIYKRVTALLLTISKSIENRDKLLKSLEEVELALTTKMSDLTKMEIELSKQDKLHSRYTEEVKSRKETLEERVRHYTSLEYALIELPKFYMHKWLNKLIEQANKFISVVWNQPLELVIPEDDKDFKFHAKYKGKIIKNLNICSSAQKDIIDLCMCLALRSPVASSDGVGMKGYPLALDETGRTFDEAHKRNLIDLFSLLTSEGLVSQICLTSHHAVIHGALTNIQTLVLNSDNIALPSEYNQSIEIKFM